MEKEFTLKKYENLEEFILASFQVEDKSMTLEDVKGSDFGGIGIDGKEVDGFTYEQYLDGLIQQGVYGFIDEDKVIHFWIGKDLPIEELIHFFAHEIGHRTGEALADDFQEEMRAEGYGYSATLAYKFAKQIKEQNEN